jgi:hypothetical protein
MRTDHWILDDKGRPVAADLLTWAKWFGTANRIVCQETIAQTRISTVFLGIDHNWLCDGPPILWETMSFGAKLNQEQLRCAGSKEQAEAMHEKMVKAVCEASGIPYDPDRERVDDPGVCRRLAAVHRKHIRELMRAADTAKRRRRRPGSG